VVDAPGLLARAAGEVVDGAGEVADGPEHPARGAGKVVDSAGQVAAGPGCLARGAGEVVDGPGRPARGARELADDRWLAVRCSCRSWARLSRLGDLVCSVGFRHPARVRRARASLYGAEPVAAEPWPKVAGRVNRLHGAGASGAPGLSVEAR
jgi:hypothetical protein